jgi:hypothetical protein
MKTIWRTLFIMIISTFLVSIAIVLLSDPQSVIDSVNEERVMLYENMGEDAIHRVVSRSDESFQAISPMVISSLGYLEKDGKIERIPNEYTVYKSIGLRDWYIEVIKCFWNQIYLSMQRFFVMVELLPLTLALIVPCAVDGYVVRMIKINSFGYTSPLFYQLGFISFFSMAGAIIVIATWPFNVPAWVYIVWAISFAVFTRSIVANTQKKM